MNLLRPAYWKDDTYYILDQLKLPLEKEFIPAETIADVRKAIVDMNLRGAPLIGASASAGIAFGIKEMDSISLKNFENCYNFLLSSRPTAVNLKNVLDETKEFFNKYYKELSKEELYLKMRDFSVFAHDRDMERNKKMGEFGANHIINLTKGKKLNISTHCNAGTLATGGYGTAVGVIYSLFEKGYVEHVWVDETRPYLQGARLTAFELAEAEIPHTIITDSTTPFLMQKEMIDVVIIGADRMARNGDFANKIGSYSLAVNALYHKIPFYTALPVETFDLTIRDGSQIVIEERSDKELLEFNGKRIAPLSSKGLHLGFDVVPAHFLTGIITEHGVIDDKISSEKIISFLSSHGICCK